ncbi:UNVERIFIED_CONTAM: hypothetical protein FKN15_061644 [Acipenser sinensis]
MTQILEHLSKQQVHPAPAPAPPSPAPEHTLALPVVATEVEQQDMEEEQDVLSLAASWAEESFLRMETQDPDLTQVTALSSELASEPEIPVLSNSVRALMERAANFLQVPWKASSGQHRSVFRPAQTSTPQPFPAFPDFLEEVKSSWQHPASAPSVSSSAATLASMERAEAVGLAQFPPVLHHRGASVSPPSRRITDAHLKKAYVAEEQVTYLANTGGLLTAYLDGMLHSVTLPKTLASELHAVSGTLLQISGFQGQALGRSLAGLLVARRQLIGCAYLLWPYFWTSGRGDPATLSQRARGILTRGSDAPLPCLGTGKGDVMVSGSYHGNPYYLNPYGTTG